MKKIVKNNKRHKEKNIAKKQTGITLIALVITIIVLLILAGVSIVMLTGNNGILTQANSAKTETTHSKIYEAMKLEATSYLTEKNAGGFDGALIEYLKRDANKPIVNDEGVINVANLMGTGSTLGNGTSIADGDVYVLKEVDNEEGKYEIIYYGKNEAQNKKIGDLIEDQYATDADDVLEFGYLFKLSDWGDLTARSDEYSYYAYPAVDRGDAIYLYSKNKLQLTNVSLVIPGHFKGKKITKVSEFESIVGLEKVKIPNTVNTIGRAAFYMDKELKEVQIPTSVTTIECYAFRNCSSLKTVYYEGSKEDWDKISIDNKYNANQPLLNANIIYNCNENAIVESATETTKLIYPDWAKNKLANMTEEEKNDLFYEGEKYWDSDNYNYYYPGQKITKELVAKMNKYSSYEELLQNYCKDNRYSSFDEMLIKKQYVNPKEYFGE